MDYLLDTNIVSHMMRHPAGSVVEHIKQVGAERICVSIVVACELRFGVYKGGSDRLSRRLDQVLEFLPQLPMESPVETHYATIRTELERSGTPIGPNDMLIAAHARTLGMAVVTDNVSEFSRVPDLQVENWLTAPGW